MTDKLLSKIIDVENKLRAARDELEEISWSFDTPHDFCASVIIKLRDLEDVLHDIVHIDLEYKPPTSKEISDRLKEHFGDFKFTEESELLKIIGEVEPVYEGKIVTFEEYLKMNYTDEQIQEMREQARKDIEK